MPIYASNNLNKKILQPISYGILASLGALTVELAYLSISPSSKINAAFSGEHLSSLLAITVLIEEFFKFILIREAAKKTSPNDLLVDALLIGLGFSFLETASAFWNRSFAQPDFLQGILLVGLIHIATAGLIGFALSKSTKPRFFTAPAILSVAFFTHLFFNYLILRATSQTSIFSYVLVIFLGLFLASRSSKINTYSQE